MAQSNWKQAPADVIKELVAIGNPAFDAVKSAFALRTPTQGEGDKNTEVVLYPTDTTLYNGEVTLQYNRLGLIPYLVALGKDGTVSWGTIEGQTKVTGTDATPAELLVVINEFLGTELSLEDIEGETPTVTSDVENVFKISLSASETNLLFIGLAEITLDQSGGKTETSSIINTPVLSGLDAPVA